MPPWPMMPAASKGIEGGMGRGLDEHATNLRHGQHERAYRRVARVVVEFLWSSRVERHGAVAATGRAP